MSESPPKKLKTDSSLPICPYGASCYRKNPMHFKEYSHPSANNSDSDSSEDSAIASTSGKQIDTTKLPPCPYGSNCYRKNLLHFAEFSHPLKDETTKPDLPEDTDSDTDVYSEDEEISQRSNPSIKKEMSLLKKYSQMTEEERKELIKNALQAKEQLAKELEETKEAVKIKEKELAKLQTEVNTGLLLVEGEKEAMLQDEVRYFDLLAERSYKEGSASQVHFRLAESQFYRLLSGNGSGYCVKRVQYVVNPPLVRKFQESRKELAKNRGEEFSYPVLAFHGTMEENITKIVEGGFKVPGDRGFTHRTDSGYYGRGAYFSEYPSYSMGYISGGTKILLCQVLLGKVYQCDQLIQGKPLMKGFDSHVSPNKKELIIFHSDHILPCYIVHFTKSTSEFKYIKPIEERPLCKNDTELQKLYWKAKKARKSTVLAHNFIKFAGSLCDTHAELGSLVIKHGGTWVEDDKATSKKGKAWSKPGCVLYNGKFIKNFNVLVTSETEVLANRNINIKALQSTGLFAYGTEKVHQEWLFHTVIKGTLQDVYDYTFDHLDDCI